MALIPLSNVLNEETTAFNNEVLDVMDYAGRNLGYTRFGDIVTASRTDNVSVQFQYNISPYNTTSTITGTGTVSHSDGLAYVNTGTGIGTARIASTNSIVHYPGHECHAIFDAIFVDPSVSFNMLIGPFNGEGFWFGYYGGTFGIGSRTGGVDTFVAQSSWNGNQLLTGDSILDPTTVNLYKITYGWGILPTTFEISVDGKNWEMVHIIDNRNAVSTPAFSNPYLPIAVEVESTGSVTPEGSVGTSSWSGGAAVGDIDTSASYRYQTFRATPKSVTASTPTNIITVQNPATWQGQTNYISSQLVHLAVSVEGNQPVDLYFQRNATVGGTPVFNAISANSSPLEYDIAGTTVSGGSLSWGTTLAKSSQQNINTQDLYLVLPPGHTSTLVASSGANTVVSCFMRVKDLF